MSNFLKHVLFVESDVEHARLRLASQNDFNIVAAFRHFDLKRQKMIDLRDMQRMMNHD